MAVYSISSALRSSACISSIKTTLGVFSAVSKASRSPGLDNAGALVLANGRLSSFAMICAKVVLPNPGGPDSSI